MATSNGKTEAPFRKTLLGKFVRLTRAKGSRIQKEVYQRCFLRRSVPEKVLLIVGCQRSGTTMLGYVFVKDLRTAVLQEQSCITGNHTLRLKPCNEINRILSRFRAPLIVVKPIVESQRTPKLLAEITNSKAVWLYRDYRDVVSSNVKRFHSQIDGLRSVVTGSPRSWRNEKVSDETLAILKQFFSEDMSKPDAAALGWYSRNILFFDLGLDKRDDVFLCNYEQLVCDPETTMRRIYRFIGFDFPKYRITGEIDEQSIGHRQSVEINDEIAVLCNDLFHRLHEAHESPAAQWAAQNVDSTNR